MTILIKKADNLIKTRHTAVLFYAGLSIVEIYRCYFSIKYKYKVIKLMFKLIMSAVLALSAVSAFAGNVTFTDLNGHTYTTHVPDKIEKHYGKDKKAMYEAILRISSEDFLLAHLGIYQLDRRMGILTPEKDEILLKNGIDMGAKMGMTKNQVLTTTHWRKPDYINTTTDEIGKIEQWIYGNHLEGSVRYLIFDRNKLALIGATIIREE